MALSSASLRRYWAPRCRGPHARVNLNGGGRVYVRPAIVEAVKALDAVLRRYGYKTYASQTGAYVCRPSKGSAGGWSLHAYGIATDINWNMNPFSYRLITNMPIAMVNDILRIRTNNGRPAWSWGGYWSGKKDCLTGDTRIVTKNGSIPIAQLKGQEVELLSTKEDPTTGRIESEWVKAPVESYGFDKTYTVTLQRRQAKTTIRCTSNHRWPVQTQNGVKLIKTENLEDSWQVKAKIPAMQYPKVEESWNIDPYHVAMGIIWGDGSDYNKHGSRTPKTSCELCDEKTELAPWLEDYAGYWRDTEHGVKAWKMAIEMNSLPDVDATLSQKISFFIGWFSADGCMKGNVPTLSTSDESALRWLKQEAPNLGLTITSVGLQEAGKSGFDSTKDNFTVVFRHIPKEYLIRSSHIDLWTPNDKAWYGWKLVSVEENEDVEEVFCATVEGRGVFAIDSPTVPILTGNSMHFQIDCRPADLATGINWRSVNGSTPTNIPRPPAPAPAPKPDPLPMFHTDEGDDLDMRLFRDHNGTAWILTGRERHAINANEYRALRDTWMPNHDMSKGSPFYNPIVSQVILNNTVRV